MNSSDEEDKLLRSVALQNAQSILLARQRAEEELVRAKEALELKTKELAHSMAMMRATLESTTDGILVTDGDGRITDFNEKFFEMWRLPHEVVGSSDHRQLLEVSSRFFKEPGEFLRRIDYIYAQSPPESYDLLELADGRLFERISRIQIVNEKNVGRVWSFSDITAFRVAEDSLRKQSDWLRVTLASVGDAVLTTDIEGRVAFLNPTAQILTGWTQEDARGRPLAEVFRIINDETRRTIDNPAQRALSEGRVVGLANHTVLVARDGTETPIDDSAAPIRDDKGRVYGAVLVFRDIAERRKAEEALRRSEQELSEFFENATVGLHWIGADGTILRANRTELEMLGYSREEYVGKPIADFHADADVVADILRTLHSGKELHDCEARMICKDGSIKYVLIDSNVRREDGKSIYSRCFTRDITDRKQVEEAQARLAAIVESSQDAIISKTLESRILSWNAGAERLFGYTAEEAIGQLIYILIPPDRKDEERLIIEQLRKGERIESYETVRVSKEGRRIDVSLTVSPIRDSAGRVIAASKIARDITANKRAEQRLRIQNGVTRAMADSVTLNEAAAKILSAVCEELAWQVGALWNVDPHDQLLRCSNVWHLPPVRIPEFEAECRRQTFQPGIGLPGRVWASAAASWIPDVTRDDNFPRAAVAGREGLRAAFGFPIILNDEVLGVLEFFSDEISEPDEVLLQIMTAVGSQMGQFIERKRSEGALRDSAIENAKLLSELREADRRKDEFLAMLAHELRNPLAPIHNAVQILRSVAPAAPELRWSTEVIDRQVHQMTRLVDDLLDVSRITTGKIELRKERVELAEVVNSAVEASRPLVEKLGHELIVSAPLQPIHLDADPTRLSQVLLNLLNNAAKYTEKAGRIWVTVEQDGDHVLIRVKDTGIGIPAEMLPKVFDMFTQVDRSLERAEGGLGIGLTLVHRLVEMHGGTVEAHSEGPGRGSEFVVRLPVATELNDDTRHEPADSEILIPPAARRILVVDDNRDSAESLVMILQMMGNDVHTAHDGLEAVAAAAEFRPEVIFLDIGLPKLNGYEAGRQIRELAGGGEMVLIALTGWGQEQDRRQSREAGFDHHLTKPVDFDNLRELLAHTNRGRRNAG